MYIIRSSRLQIIWFVLKRCSKFSAETFFSPPCLLTHSPSVKSSSIKNHPSGLCLTRRAFDVLKRRRLTNTSSHSACHSSAEAVAGLVPWHVCRHPGTEKLRLWDRCQFSMLPFFPYVTCHIECFTYPWGTFHIPLYLEKRIGEKGHLQYRPIRSMANQ